MCVYCRLLAPAEHQLIQELQLEEERARRQGGDKQQEVESQEKVE